MAVLNEIRLSPVTEGEVTLDEGVFVHSEFANEIDSNS